MKTEGRKGRWIAGGVVLGLILIVMVTTLTRRSTLISHAQRLPTGGEPYIWLSPQTVLVVRSGVKDDKNGGNTTSLSTLARIELANGAESALSASTAANYASRPDLWRASPDGMWAAAEFTSYENSPPDNILLWEIGGTRLYRWQAAWPRYSEQSTTLAEVVWLPDSRRFLVRASDKDRAYLFSVERPGGRGVPIPLPKGAKRLLGVLPDNRLVSSDFLSPKEALDAQANQSTAPGGTPAAPPPPPTTLEIHTLGLYPNSAPDSKTTLPLPADMELHDLSLSPQGDRLLWVFSTTRPSGFGALLTRFFPSLKNRFPPRTVVSLQISRLDGKDRHEIGYEDENAGASDPLTYAHWSPDGKRIGFVVKNTLYAVPAD